MANLTHVTQNARHHEMRPKVKGLEMKYMMIKVLEDSYYNIFYNWSILYNVPILFIWAVAQSRGKKCLILTKISGSLHIDDIYTVRNYNSRSTIPENFRTTPLTVFL